MPRNTAIPKRVSANHTLAEHGEGAIDAGEARARRECQPITHSPSTASRRPVRMDYALSRVSQSHTRRARRAGEISHVVHQKRVSANHTLAEHGAARAGHCSASSCVVSANHTLAEHGEGSLSKLLKPEQLRPLPRAAPQNSAVPAARCGRAAGKSPILQPFTPSRAPAGESAPPDRSHRPAPGEPI